MVVLVLLLCLLLLALEGSKVGEEIAQFLGGLWGMTGLFELTDALCRSERMNHGERAMYVRGR